MDGWDRDRGGGVGRDRPRRNPFESERNAQAHDDTKTKESRNLYATLNVASDASSNEIKSSYRELSKVFHPDKVKDNRQLASTHFQDIQTAYEILSDDTRRALYDDLGMAGVEAFESSSQRSVAGWKVGAHLREPSALGKYVGEIVRTKYFDELRDEYPANGELEVSIDATNFVKNLMTHRRPRTPADFERRRTLSDAFDFGVLLPSENDDEDDEDSSTSSSSGDYGISISGTSVSHQGVFVLPNNSAALVEGHLSSSSDSSSPELTVGVRYVTKAVLSPDDTVAVGGVIGKSKSSNAYVSMTRFLTRHHRSELKFLVSPVVGGELTFANERKISASIQGSAVFAMATSGRMISRLACEHEPPGSRNRVETSVQTVGRYGVGVVKYRRALTSMHYVSASVRATNLSGSEFQLALSANFSARCQGSVGISIGPMRGIVAHVKINHGGSSFHAPITLSKDTNRPLFQFLAFVPLVAYQFSRFFWKLWERRINKVRQLKDLNEKGRRRVEAREEALSQQKLMRAASESSRARETARHGLVIVLAVYGSTVEQFLQKEERAQARHFRRARRAGVAFPEEARQPDEDPDFPPFVDVTIPLQFHVRDSSLRLDHAHHSNQLGFCDPDPSHTSRLYVRYTFRDQEYETLFDGSAGGPQRLELPNIRDHSLRRS